MSELESQWLIMAQQGNIDAFTKLVELYQRPVFNLCHRMLNDSYEAEDAAQETFMRAYTNMKRYDTRRSFSTWLLSIAAHYCIDQIRKRRMVLISFDDAPYLEPPDKSLGPEAALSLSEDKNRVQELLAHLNPTDRAAVIMFYWYEMSYQEISEALNLTVSAIKSRLHRARLGLANTFASLEAQKLSLERTKNGKAESPAFQ